MSKTLNTGIGNKYVPFQQVRRNTSKVEKLINNNSSNSYICLGKDRVSSTFSGFGGTGDPAADAIDIVVGPAGDAATETLNNGEKVLNTNPHFGKDAGRIYITQKGNIDTDFGLADGMITERGRMGTSSGKSAIALKADHIRIISRELIKLVSSGTDSSDLNGGVNLIAGNDEDKLQSMVLGDNLVDYIDNNLLVTLSGILQVIYDFMQAQTEFNSIVITHNHISPFFGIPNSPSPTLLAGGSKNLLSNLENLINNVKLTANNEVSNKFKLLPLSNKHFLSKYHKLN